MAEITAYPLGTPATDTLLVGTQMNVPQSDGTKANLTRNFPISQISTLITQDYVEVTKTISNAEWLNLPTTGVIVVPAVASKRIQVVSAYARFNYATTSFFFSSDLVLAGSAVLSTLTGDFIQARVPQDFEDIDGDDLAILGLEACTPLLGTPLYFGTLAAATNTGGGTVSITVRYTLI